MMRPLRWLCSSVVCRSGWCDVIIGLWCGYILDVILGRIWYQIGLNHFSCSVGSSGVISVGLHVLFWLCVERGDEVKRLHSLSWSRQVVHCLVSFVMCCFMSLGAITCHYSLGNYISQLLFFFITCLNSGNCCIALACFCMTFMPYVISCLDHGLRMCGARAISSHIGLCPPGYFLMAISQDWIDPTNLRHCESRYILGVLVVLSFWWVYKFRIVLSCDS